MDIGKKIIELRKKIGLTQEQLSEKLGVSRQTLSNWEKSITTPDITQAKSIASLFKISLDDLTDNKILLECANNYNSPLNDLIGKQCLILMDEDYIDPMMNYNTKLKVIEVSNSFIKVEYETRKKKITKLIDLDIIISIKVIEEEYK